MIDDNTRIIKQVLRNVTEADMYDLILDAIPNYVDDDWDKSYELENKYDFDWEWYKDYGEGDAESEVIHDVVLQAAYELGIALDDENLAFVIDRIADEFDLLM